MEVVSPFVMNKCKRNLSFSLVLVLSLLLGKIGMILNVTWNEDTLHTGTAVKHLVFDGNN